jgi:hypothetical protein
MSIDNMRIAIATVYPGAKWFQRVKKMSDNQVLAIYQGFLRTKKL